MVCMLFRRCNDGNDANTNACNARPGHAGQSRYAYGKGFRSMIDECTMYIYNNNDHDTEMQLRIWALYDDD